ncbi:MAG: RraA family protein [Thermoguttaceae bacterium]|nr:RraA family protein [Thermoguttaceae bacterium]MDW8079872.1 RraA family protein [Thermoguttaceae bacterium]
MSVSREILRRLAQFDTPTISNVIELFGIRPANTGFMDGRIRALFPELPPMVGFACTAAFRSAAPPAEGQIYHSLADQIRRAQELPGPAVMVFQDLDDPPVGATFGEIMCTVYKAFGSVGLITSGGGRDILQVRRLEYPVFVGSTISSHAYCHILHIGEPVRVGGLVVRHGDLLHGDANGVVQIPVEIASEVADVASEYLQAEQILLDFARRPGVKTLAGLEAAQAEFAAAVDRLRRRLRRL